MAQDFWASSGFRFLERRAAGLAATDAWLVRFVEGAELQPPHDAGPRERLLHHRMLRNPLAPVDAHELAAIEDGDARDNWTEFLRFRDRVLAHPSLEAVYLDLYRRASVDLAPPFVDALTQAITRGILDGTEDPWLCRAGEMLFRRQRVSTEGGQALAADCATLEAFAETGGFGNVGRLLKQQNTALPPVKMDILNHENAAFYFMRDEMHSFALDITPGREGVAAIARVLERWVRHLAGADVTIEPVERIDDERWRWHVGLDVDSTAILNALYKGEDVAPGELDRMVALFRLEFRNASDAAPEMRGRPVYLGLACRPDRTLRMKAQNLVTSLPLHAGQ